MKAATKKLSKKKGCPDHIDRLYRAVEAYVKSAGGGVMVIGGIQIIQWPDDGKYKFTVGIKCCGTIPKFAKSSEVL